MNRYFSLASLAAITAIASTQSAWAAFNSAGISPAQRPATGGAITMSADVTLPAGVKTVAATVYKDGQFYTSIGMTNGGSGSVYSGSFNVGLNKDISAHVITATFYATDMQNHTIYFTEPSGSCVWQNDNTPPAISSPTLNPTGIAITGGTLNISANVADNGAMATGVQSVTANIFRSGVFYTNVALSGMGGNYSGSLKVSANTAAGPATWTAAVKAVDTVGNQSSASIPGSCVQDTDTIAPVITNAALTPDSISIAGGTLTVSANIADAQTGLQYMTADIFRNGSRYTTLGLVNKGGSVFGGTLAVGPNRTIANATWKAVVSATDAVGHKASVPAIGATTQANDNAGPVVTNATMTPSTISSSGGLIVVSAAISDTGVGMLSTTSNIFRDGLYYTSLSLAKSATSNSYSGTYAMGQNLDGMTHVFTTAILATDAVGNQTGQVVTGSCTQTSSKPNVSAPSITNVTLTPTILPVLGGVLTVQATATDTGGLHPGIYSVSANIIRDGVIYTTVSMSNGGNGSIYKGLVSIGTNNGIAGHVWQTSVSTIDLDSNKSGFAASVMSTQATDNIAPIITNATQSPAQLGAVGGSVLVSATVTDTGGDNVGVYSVSAEITKDGAYYTTIFLTNNGIGNVYTGSWVVSANTDNTPHVWASTILAGDLADNKTTSPVTGTTTQTYDNMPPVITGPAITPARIGVTGGMITVKASVTDTGGSNVGVKSVSADLFKDGAYYTTVTLTNNGGTYTGGVSISGNSDGIEHIYTATVWATDNLGNKSSASALGATTQAYDNTAPVITNAAVTPPIINTAGGLMTVSATVADTDTNSSGMRLVGAQINRDGVYYTNISLTNGGSGNTYTRPFTVPRNDDGMAHVWTAAVYASDNLSNSSQVAAAGQSQQSAAAGTGIK